MKLPEDRDLLDLELLAYFAEQRGWHEIAEEITATTESALEQGEPEAVIYQAHWQRLFDVFDDQAAA
jgi:hypothetical protein